MEHKMEYKQDRRLLNCPYCGSPMLDESYDRRIVFKCSNPACGFKRTYDGILTTVKNNVPIRYYRLVPKNKWQAFKKKYFPKWIISKYPISLKKEDVPPEEVTYQEYLHTENKRKAIDSFNEEVKRIMAYLRNRYGGEEATNE